MDPTLIEPTSDLSNPKLPTNCWDTALCIVPPKTLWPSIEALRSLYDPAFEKWPPHVNLIYPFVPVSALDQAVDRIVSYLRNGNFTSVSRPINLRLDAAGVFTHKKTNTIYAYDDNHDRSSYLTDLRAGILRALGEDSISAYQLHMSLASMDATEIDMSKFILDKVRLLPTMGWSVDHFVVLKRDRDGGPPMMRFWKAIGMESLGVIREPKSLDLYEDRVLELNPESDAPTPQETYRYSSTQARWTVLDYTLAKNLSNPGEIPETLVVASYNVLAEFTWPPSQTRHLSLVQNLLTETAVSDILVLEEVTDDFLSYLLADDRIAERYPFSSHGPPCQTDLGPLPSLLNQVVLSRIPFHWKQLKSKRRHKTSAIANFPSIVMENGQQRLPLVLATCHLSQGLTDGAVAAKIGELQRIIDHLHSMHTNNPWIIAGDFNLTTSRCTIDAALKKKAISKPTAARIASFDEILRDFGLLDAWVTARCEVGESSDDMRHPRDVWDAFEGEQGATFDPSENLLASKLVGDGVGNRPQRYDRILVKTENAFTVAGFNMFGFPLRGQLDGESDALPASDHWGIRCLLRRKARSRIDRGNDAGLHMDPVPFKSASPELRDPESLKTYLQRLGSFPTEEDEALRKQAFGFLRSAIMDAIGTSSMQSDSSIRKRPPLVIDSVGSYALGVWSRDSDIDCLCVGPFSSRTFFSVIASHFKQSSDIKILRRVKANTGTMLELEIAGIRVDLQYCGATSIAENWSDVLKRPANDPAFALSTQTLLKLKPARDVAYLRRSIPDLAQFRLAYLLIKAWAKERGIYAAKFGYLGGVHIASMLVPICKMLRHSGTTVSTADIIVTFFNYYAAFKWKEKAILDPFFHKNLMYTRTPREAMCLLGWHAPSLNTALTASPSTTRTISTQIQKANSLLSQQGTSWPVFLGVRDSELPSSGFVPGRSGAAAFLQEFKSYIKIDVHYWGKSRSKGKQFVGWLESRCVIVLVDIDRRIPGLGTRIWPSKFSERHEREAHDGEDLDFRVSILIGLEWHDDGGIRTKEDLKAAEGTLTTVLNHFESRIRGDEAYYDAKTCWVSATVASRSEISELELDGREWAEYTGREDDSNSDLDDEPVGPEEEGHVFPQARIHERHDLSLSEGGARAGKFRTAMDVMNRLRWDENMDSADYIVGYEDRFVGIKERALDEWTGEQTDEEFIPQHRIQYFKRRSDGVIIWDRGSRVDLIFGSGKKAAGIDDE